MNWQDMEEELNDRLETSWTGQLYVGDAAIRYLRENFLVIPRADISFYGLGVAYYSESEVTEDLK